MEYNQVIKYIPYHTVFMLICVVCVTNGQNFEVTFSLKEEAPRWTFVGNVSTARDFMTSISLEDRDSLLFSFLQQTSVKSILSIHDETGSLYTTVVIDRESLPECKVPGPCLLTFDIAASSSRKDSFLFEIISVIVVILDINDNSPIFPLDTQTIYISESAVNGSVYLIEGATDDDSGNNSIQHYELIGNSDIFTINVERKLDGSLTVKLILIGKLDRETKDYYNCTIVATDGGVPPRAGSMKLNITILDYNDNAPVLLKTSYDITVQEDIEPVTGILKVEAKDRDIGENGHIQYRFSPHQADLEDLQSLFGIDEETGVVSVVGQLVYKPDKVYRVIVEAIDRGNPPMLSTNQAIVSVRVQDTGNNPPKVNINLLSTGNGMIKNVSEISGPGTFVAHVEVEDTDTGSNGVVTCDVAGSMFALESLPNKGYKVIVKGKLDRERQDIHTVIITCQDQGIPSLATSASFMVRVTDENDNAPLFTQKKYVENFYENNEIQDVVIGVSARDIDIGDNGNVHYYLDDSVRGIFRIDRYKGTIRAMRKFDREDRDVWNFRVYANDSGDPPQVGFADVEINILDANDNRPIFEKSQYNFSIQENLSSGHVVNRVSATDNDTMENGIHSYVISDTKEKDLPFFLFPDGVIKNTRELDREAKSKYEFTIIAIDKGTPKLTSSAQVIVRVEDINDNKPEFLFPSPRNNTVKLIHMRPAGTVVARINAYDPDEGNNKKLSYLIEDGNDKKLFLMDVNTGVLTMARRYKVEDDMDEYFPLTISVQDSGVPQLSTRTELHVIIKYSNLTLDLDGMDGKGEEGSGSNNLAIVVVVALLTAFLSAAIIAVICVIRKYDRDRMKTQNAQVAKLPNNLADLKEVDQNGTIVSHQYDKLDSSKKKKEVSFSFEELDGFRDHEISFSNNSVFTDNIQEKPHHEREQSHQMKTFQLHHQGLLGSPSSPWGNHAPSQKIQETKIGGNPEDNHSDTSRETVTSDSGRGGSEDDLPVSHNSSKDEKDPRGNSVKTPHIMKCSVPSPNKQGLSRDRPHSVEFSDPRNPHTKVHYDRSLSNLVGSEKPKFTVRKPYIEREVRDKKSQSEGWVPSYV